jgi:hypothetical protein
MNPGRSKSETYLEFVLWLFILHTTGVALGLILLPTEYLSLFGFENYQGNFFKVQAGVFHLVMGLAYLLALHYYRRIPALVFFSIIAKSMALVFLVIYYFFFENNWIILASGIADGALGLLLLILYSQFKRLSRN